MDNNPSVEATLLEVTSVVSDQLMEVGTLCEMLEITVEDILEKFADRVFDYSEKFGVKQVIANAEESGTNDYQEVAEDEPDFWQKTVSWSDDAV